MSVHSPVLPRRTHSRKTAPENSLCLKRYVADKSVSGSPRPPSVGNPSAASNIAANGEDHNSTVARWMPDSLNADKWFDDSNQNASGKSNVRFIDNDSPFYLRRNRSSEESTKSGRSCSQKTPFNYGPPTINQSGSSSEDFRSVIDDLTIENKELKRKLRRYEQLHASHMQEDKLFEVRVHGLSPVKRRQLEQTLRDFAAGIGGSTDADSPAMTSLAGKNTNLLKCSTSSQSNSKPVDSAYASLSASGDASVPRSQTLIEPIGQPVHTSSKDQKVHKYLQDISQVLLPKQSPLRSEKATKRLVVQRLEQLFVGRVGSSNKHSQSQQQQEVSQSAASADRQATEAMGQRVSAEGEREAKIYHDPYELGDGLIRSGITGPLPVDAGLILGETIAAAPDQRPTRPLDLDPCRAQNPAENIQYMKHLGFDSPKMEVDTTLGDGEGWIYLNLLINMAQLHTLNVTPDFVRTAISEQSSKFEISKDSQSVRWKGGKNPTRVTTEIGRSSMDRTNSPTHATEGICNQAQAESNKIPPDDTPSTLEAEQFYNWQRPSCCRRDGEKSSIIRRTTQYQSYSPLFLFNDDDAKYGLPRVDRRSSTSVLPVDDKSGINSKVSSTKERKSYSPINIDEPGPIIFYHGAKFCTDLSGDFTPQPAYIRYDRSTKTTLGNGNMQAAEGTSEYTERGPPTVHPVLSDQEYFDFATSGELKGFRPAIFSENQNDNSYCRDIKLPVSGIGGVAPADNFQIEINRKFYGNKSLYLSIIRHELAPSELPSPSYAFPHSASSCSESNACDGVEEISYGSARASRFAADRNVQSCNPSEYLGTFSTGSTHMSREDSSDDSSIDMLDFARKADPHSVAAQEREFDQHAISMPVETEQTESARFPKSNVDKSARTQESRHLVDLEKGLKRVLSGEPLSPGPFKVRRLQV